jgi:hypothetical protein
MKFQIIVDYLKVSKPTTREEAKYWISVIRRVMPEVKAGWVAVNEGK